MFAQSLKKIFSGHHFIFLTFLKKMNLKHCITLIVTKKRFVKYRFVFEI